MAVALLLTFALGTGGGFGALAATRLLPPQVSQAPQEAAVTAATVLQPTQYISTAAGSNVAGEVFKKVNPSVVQVIVAGRSASGRMGSGAGSGFVVDSDGHAVTNNHVVEGARAISVRFSSGASREAKIVGTDRGNDLALLQVDLPEGVPAALLGDSDRVEVGEIAIAIGGPFGLDRTVTQGIISAVNRTWSPGDGRARRGLLQTDAPINPGNSGGPLLNAAGEVIGVTSMIESPIRGNVGVGFAIPINTARRLLPQLESGAKLEPVWLGITGQPVDVAIARDQALTVQEGVLVLSVVPDGPAAQAGLRGGQNDGGERIARGGDVIVALEGSPIKDLDQLVAGLSGRQPGETVTLAIVRGGQRQDVKVKLQPWPAELPTP